MSSVPLLEPLEVYLLGRVEFEDAQRLQRRLIYDLGEPGAGGALILCEHPPTITVGRSGSRAHILPDDDELRLAGVRTHWVNRGGGCVLHLPGQLVAYVMIPLSRFEGRLGEYLSSLQRVVLAFLAEFDLTGHTRTDVPGVFLGDAQVASIGVAVNRWITSYGLTVNVGPYLRAFSLIEEPGWDSASLRQTSMESRRQRPVPMARARETLIREIETAFAFERSHLYTDHPLISPRARSHVAIASLP